jgi:hypothetical protein
MPDPRIEIDVPAWVERARNDPVAYRSRQATEIIPDRHCRLCRAQ